MKKFICKKEIKIENKKFKVGKSYMIFYDNDYMCYLFKHKYDTIYIGADIIEDNFYSEKCGKELIKNEKELIKNEKLKKLESGNYIRCKKTFDFIYMHNFQYTFRRNELYEYSVENNIYTIIHSNTKIKLMIDYGLPPIIDLQINKNEFNKLFDSNELRKIKLKKLI